MRRSISIVFLIYVSLSCDRSVSQTEYSWVQNTNGISAPAPIVHRIKLRWSAGDDTLYVNQMSEDANSKTQIEKREWFDWSDNGFGTRCEKYDDLNWVCELFSPSDPSNKFSLPTTNEAFKMKNGELTWIYWGEERQMKPTSRREARTQQ